MENDSNKDYWLQDNKEHFERFTNYWPQNISSEVIHLENDDWFYFKSIKEIINLLWFEANEIVVASKDTLEVKVFDYITALLFIRLREMWISLLHIPRIISKFITWYIENNIDVLDFQYYLIKKWATVNIYILDNNNYVLVKSEQWFNEISQEFSDTNWFLQSHISISLNELFDVGNIHKEAPKQVMYELSDKEKNIIKYLNNNDYTVDNVNIWFKSWIPENLTIIWHTLDVSKQRELKNKIPFWSVAPYQHEWIEVKLDIIDQKKV